MNWACIALPLLRTLLAIHQKSCEPSFREVMDSTKLAYVLVAYASLAVSSILLQQLLASLHLTLDSEDLFCWQKQKIEVTSMNCGSSTQSWKPLRWVRLHLIFTMRDTYNNSNLNPLRKFNSSSRSTKHYLPMEHLSNYHEDPPNQHDNTHKLFMKWGILLPIWWAVNGNWDNNMIRISQWRGSHCRASTSIRQKKSKRAGL